MTYEEIEEQFPEEFVRREKDKLAYRYPRGVLAVVVVVVVVVVVAGLSVSPR